MIQHVYLARQDVSAQQVEDLTKAVHDRHRAPGGKVTKNEYWGVKSLNPSASAKNDLQGALHAADVRRAARCGWPEVERQQRINEDVLRYLTVRVEELEEGPSAR